MSSFVTKVITVDDLLAYIEQETGAYVDRSTEYGRDSTIPYEQRQEMRARMHAKIQALNLLHHDITEIAECFPVRKAVLVDED